jgi:hypothetical protein
MTFHRLAFIHKPEHAMADKPIRITWDDIHDPAVDDRLKQQQALNRAQEHYQQAPPVPRPAHQGANPFYNTIVYMTIFGLLGGLVAWVVCEAVYQLGKTDLLKFVELSNRIGFIKEDENKGKITRAEAQQRIEAIERQARDNSYFKVQSDLSVSPQEARRRVEDMVERDKTKMFFVEMIFLGFCGTIIALSLSSAEPLVTRNLRGLLVNGSVGAALGLFGGLLLSLFISQLYRLVLGADNLPEPPGLPRRMFARALAWGILGFFLSIAPGIVMRNWKKLVIGLVGGLLGGILGGLQFDPVSDLLRSDVLSRAVGITAIGLIAGVGTGLIENVAKTGWLRVTAGLIAGKQFILYRDPTQIGSSPQCEIYLFKDAQISPQHAAIHLLPGRCELEDLNSRTGTFVNGQLVQRVRLRHGDQIQIGSTCFLFQEKARGDRG